MVAMIAVITWHARGLHQAWREKVPGARLHIRIVGLFSIIAALPALLLAIGATASFSRSLDSWFSKRTRAIIDNSITVARTYVEEHGTLIRNDIVNMARDIDDAADGMDGEVKKLQPLLLAQAALRELPVAYIINGSGTPLVKAEDDPKTSYLTPPRDALAQAEAGQVAISLPRNNNRVAAIVKLQRHPGQFLYVARGLSGNVLQHVRLAEQNVDEFERLRASRFGLKLAHGLMYLLTSMTGLLAAIWAGLWFAGRFVAPIRRLIGAAQRVSHGDLNVILPEKRGEGDLRRLSLTFNTMTRELKTQRDALVTANSQLLERRRFMEAVLSGVTAGVIGIDRDGAITLVNRSAERLLDVDGEALIGKRIAEALPAFQPLFEREGEGALKPRRQAQLTLMVGSEERTFAAKATEEHGSDAGSGAVVTFDDITELVSAQRTSAWADVARRIAHEIKNPLTPIILSAERIRRKYGKAITEDRETFDKLTATIERQAGDIKTMVDEFASFARVPKPVIEAGDLRDAVQEPVILFREGTPAIKYDLVMPDAPASGSFDRRLITQAITNLVKNASEAVAAAAELPEMKAIPGWKGRVETRLEVADDRFVIEVIDNGIGLPKQNRSKLLEPYVTTKGHKGTGLGLAIVQKITEQHGGSLTLDDAPPAPDRPRGALVRITLPRTKPQPGEATGPPPGLKAAGIG
jgi:two-component system nitrogen regulation sensor histidine kinase NtrY